MAELQLDGVEKTYPGGHVAVRRLDLTVQDGELLVLVGPSGCGKSTTLRLVAGLETPTAGRVLIGGRDVTGMPPHERDVAMVFQTYALYPHKTVRENLAFPLRMRRLAAREAAARVSEVAAMLGLDALLDHKPRQLSGGQRQRVALGRAMVREPRAFLLDEPLSNLDARLRVRTRAELARLHRRLGATMLYVTHDQEEALTLGDRVAVLHEGVLQQVAPPMELYRAPANVFVAGFIGSPAMNLLAGRVRAGPDGRRLECDGVAAPLEVDLPADAPQDVTVGVRPSDVEVVGPGVGDAVGQIEVVEPLGRDTLLHVAVGNAEAGEAVRVVVPAAGAPPEGSAVGLRLRRDRLLLFDHGSGKRLTTSTQVK